MSAATGNGAGSGSGSGGGRTFASAALAEAGDVAAPQLVCVCESSVLDKLLALDAANARVKLLNLRTGRARTLHRVDAGFTPVRIDRLREERYALFQLRADGSGLVILLEEQLRPKIVAFWKDRAVISELYPTEVLTPPADFKFEAMAAMLQTRTDNVLLLPSGSNRMYEFVLDTVASLSAAPAPRPLERKIGGRVHQLPGEVVGATLLALGGREALAAAFSDSSVRLFRLETDTGRPEPIAVVREAISVRDCCSCTLGAMAWLRNLSSVVLLANMTSSLSSSSSSSSSGAASGSSSTGNGTEAEKEKGAEAGAASGTGTTTCTTGALVCLRVRDEGAPGVGAFSVSDEAKLVRFAAPVDARSLAVLGRVGRSCLFALSADRSHIVEHVLNY